MADEIDPKILEDHKKSIIELTKWRREELKVGKKTFEERIKLVREEFRDRRQAIRDEHKSGLIRKELLALLEKEEKQLEKELTQREKQRKLITNVSSALGGLYSAAEKGEGTISSFTGVFAGRGVLGDAFSALGTRLDSNIETLS